MDIYSLLKKEHDNVRKMFSGLSKKKEDQVFKDIEEKILLHSSSEDKICYQSLAKKTAKLKFLLKVADNEQHQLQGLIEEVRTVNEPEWQLIREVIEKEFLFYSDIEEKEIFKLTKEHFSDEEANYLAERMKKRKVRLMEEGNS